MAKIVKTKSGKEVVLLNPSERARRYSIELSTRSKVDGTPLTEAESGFRMGVLNERKLQAKIYNKQHGLKSKSKKVKK